MKYLSLNLSKLFPLLATISLLFTACDKVKTTEPLNGVGPTLVKLIQGGATDDPGVITFAIDFVPVPITITGADIRRDVANNIELNKTMTVIVKDDTAALRAYDPTLVYLPSSWYTIGSATPKVGGAGGTFTITLQPGEIAKQIELTIPNATLLNPSATYGLAFTILSADANGIVSANKTVVVKIGAKNIYDGRYEVSFCNYHPTSNPGYTCGVAEVHMVTTGANSVKIYFPAAGGFFNPAILGGDLSYFGAQEPQYTINTTTNAVTVQNAFVGAVTFYTMAVGFNSWYDPGSKTFFAKWGYSYAVPGVFDAGAREWTQTIKYLGPR